MNSKITYRPDIDGLRAVAVLSVFAFHLGLYRFARGGFVGVDIFFVISGYLITQIVAKQIHSESFSISDFYRRRVLRILPAFLMMVIGVLIGSLLILPPVEVVEVARSAIAASMSLSNVFFYNSPIGYFFDDLNARPLLHTWSLGIEEQFYAFFPFVLITAHRWFSDRLRAAVAAAGLASFAISLWSLRHAPESAFFLLPSRFWELMLGAAASLGIIKAPNGRWKREIFALIGATAMAISIAITNGGYMPYWWAILPCVGAVMVITAGEGGRTFAGGLLSWPPLVWIGLISYSLYLWHWPMIVFYHVGLLQPWTMPARATVFVISLALATVSYLGVERPFRSLPRAIPNWRILTPGVSAIAATATVGMVMVAFSGFPARYSPQADLVSASLNARSPDRFRSGTCFISKPDETFDWQRCLGPETGTHRVILFGDSHAAVFVPGLLGKVDLRQVTATYCRPLIGMDKAGLPFCSDIVEKFLGQYLKGHHQSDTIIISERWGKDQEAALRKTIEVLRKTGARVILVGPVPEYSLPLPRLEFASLVTGRDMVSSNLDRSFEGLDQDLEKIATLENVKYVSPASRFCSSGKCRALIAGYLPVVSDTDHLSSAAASQIAKEIIYDMRG